MLIDDWLAAWTPSAPGDRALRFRRELGIEITGPVVMTGHQPGFWHAGILAKYLAARAIADRTASGLAWCVPDMDPIDPGLVRRPVGNDEPTSRGKWKAEESSLLAWTGLPRVGRLSEPTLLVPTGARAPGVPVGDPPSGFERAVELLDRFRGETTVARQVWRAHAALLGTRSGLAADTPVVYATELARTSLFRGLVDRMRADPAACVHHYNESAEKHPESGIRPLLPAESPGQAELPLWRIEPGAPRRAVRAEDLDAIDPARLAPRALLFTGILRLAGCELFLHGTGGGVYDRVTEDWFGGWIGETLPRAGVVSATALLDLGVPEVSREELARAEWRAHHAGHTPAMLGDDPGQAEKDRCLERIRSGDRAERAVAFAEMQGVLERARRRGGARMEQFEQEARDVRAALADASIANDRGWPWMLHTEETLGALRDEIGRALSGWKGEE